MMVKGKTPTRHSRLAPAEVKLGSACKQLLIKNMYYNWCGSLEHLLQNCLDFKTEITTRVAEHSKKKIKALAIINDLDSNDLEEQFFDKDFGANLNSIDKVTVHLIDLY